MTISQALTAAHDRLAHLDDDHSLIARQLVAHITGLSQTQLWTNSDHSLTLDQQALLQSLINRAADHEPLAYLLGYKDFYGRRFLVTPDTLIPRPESEQLINLVLQSPVSSLLSPVLVDVGTGSGCLAITLALELPHASVYAIDISEEALQVAQRNASALQASNITFLHGSLLEPVSSLLPTASIDSIVANLPYISDNEYQHLPTTVKDYEPQLALVSGQHPDSLNHQLVDQAQALLTANGLLFYETTNGRIVSIKNNRQQK